MPSWLNRGGVLTDPALLQFNWGVGMGNRNGDGLIGVFEVVIGIVFVLWLVW